MSDTQKYYKSKFFFTFYEKDDETFYDNFNNVKEIVERMKSLGVYPAKVVVGSDGKVKKTDLNSTQVTRQEVQFVSIKLARSLRRETFRHHLINLFGRDMRVYLVDIDDDNED